MELVTPLPIWLAAFDKSWQLPALRPFSNTAAYFVVPHCPRGQHDNLASHWSRGIIGQSAWAARYWIGKDHSQSSSVLPLSHVGRNWHKDPIYRIHGTMHATVLSLPSTEKAGWDLQPQFLLCFSRQSAATHSHILSPINHIQALLVCRTHSPEAPSPGALSKTIANRVSRRMWDCCSRATALSLPSLAPWKAFKVEVMTTWPQQSSHVLAHMRACLHNFFHPYLVVCMFPGSLSSSFQA